MPTWKPSLSDIVRTIAHQIERQHEWLRATVKRSLRWIGPVKVLPYRGYGNAHQLFLMGRVIEDKPLGSPREDDTRWQNVKAMYRRFATDKIPNVPVRATAYGQNMETHTDTEGYFRIHFQFAEPLESDDPWKVVHLELLENVSEQQDRVRAEGHVLVPPATSRFGVISDVDDTIIHSYATDFFKLARITFMNNVLTRTPLPGVSRFYRALEQNGGGRASNPFFYVSSSAWNLYDLIEQFLDLHDIPSGPILLRDLGLDEKKFIKSGHRHKLGKIEGILQTCHQLPFVLIGDAGQEDPVIYREVVRRYPERISAIYIRTVGNQKRNDRVRQMVKESRESEVPMLLVENVDEALDHAKAIGLLLGTD